MFWKIVLRGSNPSGRVLAVLYARTGETIDSLRKMLDSHPGLLLQAGMTKENADILAAELPSDGSVEIHIQRDEVTCVPVLIGYRPGSRGRLRIALQKLSRLSTEEVIEFISHIPISLKTDVDRPTAESIKTILERAGGIVEIRSARDLIGVSSRKKQRSPMVSTKDESKEPVTVTAPVTTHSSADSNNEPNHPKKDKTGIVKFGPPSLLLTDIPPVLDKEVTENFTSLDPYVIRFTVPAAPVPVLVPTQQYNFLPPGNTQPRMAVLIYLFPVTPGDEKRVADLLCKLLNISQEKVEQLIKNAPVALAGFNERIDALVAISELTEHGIPVSLIPNSSDKIDSSQGQSLFGWLNGHGRKS